MHFVLVPTGSAGDVNPYLGIGCEMIRRGHDVTVVTGGLFEDAVRNTGADFVAHQTSADLERIIDNPDLWHPVKGLGVIFSSMIDMLDYGMTALESACRPDSFLVGHSLSFHARAHEEITGLPAVTLHLAPSAFRSNNVLPASVPGIDLGSLPVWTKRLIWRFADRMILDRAILPQFNPWRAKRGLPPVRRLFKSWIHSPGGTIGLFPKWFAPPQPDWAGAPQLTQFPLYDQSPDWAPEPELQRFLDAGDPPILFCHGSANKHARHFFTTAIKSAELVGRRAILQTGYPELLPAELADGALHVNYAPFSKLLPACAAIVHHGGIGTSAQGLAAGIPQVIVPMGFDQPDNATHLMRLGVANWVSVARLNPSRLAARLKNLLTDSKVAERCQTCSDRFEGVSPTNETVDLIESLATRAGQKLA